MHGPRNNLGAPPLAALSLMAVVGVYNGVKIFSAAVLDSENDKHQSFLRVLKVHFTTVAVLVLSFSSGSSHPSSIFSSSRHLRLSSFPA